MRDILKNEFLENMENRAGNTEYTDVLHYNVNKMESAYDESEMTATVDDLFAKYNV